MDCYTRNFLHFELNQSHRYFSGLIHESDFCTDSPTYPGKVADNIAASLSFDYQCKRNAELINQYREKVLL